MGEGEGEGTFPLQRVLFAEAAEGSSRATSRHLLETDAPSAEFSGVCNSMAWNNHPRTDIVTSPAETAGFGSNFKGHTHFSTHPSSNKSERLSVHLFITHPDAETAEDTPVIFHGKSNFEEPHPGSDVLSYLHIWSAGHQEFG
jgi:hypothetical protein